MEEKTNITYYNIKFFITGLLVLGGGYFYYLLGYSIYTGRTVGIRGIYEEIHKIESSLPERTLAKIIDEEMKQADKEAKNR